MSLRQRIEAAKQRIEQSELQRATVWIARQIEVSPEDLWEEATRIAAAEDRLPAALRGTEEGTRQALRALGAEEEEIEAILREDQELAHIFAAGEARGWRN